MLSYRKLAPQIVTLVLLMMACATDDNFGPNQSCITGQGGLVDKTFTLSSFSKIAFAVPGNLQLSQGTPQSVEISAQNNIFDELIVRVVNDELQIELDRCVSNMTPLEMQVTIPDVESLSMAGTGTITGKNAMTVDNLVVKIAGVGEVTLFGEADNFDIGIAGSGEVRTFNLVTDNCQVDIAGQGDVEVQVTDALTVNIAGSGTVFYKGDPTISSNISGSGMVVDSN